MVVSWSLSLPCLWQHPGTAHLLRGHAWSPQFASLGETLEVGLCTQGQHSLPAQQLVQDVYFSISPLDVLKRSPGHVVLELIGTKKLMGTGPPLLEEKGQIHITTQVPLKPDYAYGPSVWAGLPFHL